MEKVIGEQKDKVLALWEKLAEEEEKQEAILILTDHELEVLNKSIDEVIRQIEEWEFQTRLGVSISEMKAIKDKLNKAVEFKDAQLFEPDPEIKEVAVDLGDHWLMCPLCNETWENHLEYASICCPQCHHRLYNAHFKHILKWIAAADSLKPQHYEIKYLPGLGYYLYVFKNEICIYNYLQNSMDDAVKYAMEEFGVEEKLWKKNEKPKYYGIR